TGIRLTSAGRTCMRYAERMLALRAEMLHRAANAKTLAGTVRMGVSETIALTWLPSRIARLAAEYPEIWVELEVDVNALLQHRFEKGELDCILLAAPVLSSRAATKFLGQLSFNWVASPTLRLPFKRLGPKTLSDLTIVTLSQQSNLYQLIQEWFSDAHANPPKYCLCNSLSVVTALTRNGAGIALLPDIFVEDEMKAHALVRVPVLNAPIQMKYYCAYPIRGENVAVKIVAKLAKETSTFPTGPELRQSLSRQ
ncbi:MAG TPA: substrate-binding domain-containing protein, partial [Candidatus Sulfotelmatobacter sp.]|nr:substrate-binding domain-containing protein [Candidatus Sulfotelmatobacter sp.]